MKLTVTLLSVVPALQALRLKVSRDFTDENNQERKTGDEMLFEGPGTYVPRKEVDVVGQHNTRLLLSSLTLPSNCEQSEKLWTEMGKPELLERNGC